MRKLILVFLLLFAPGIYAQLDPPENFQTAICINLAWDHSPSPNIANYKIYWGNSSRSYADSALVDGTETSYQTVALGPATWYFAATAINAEGDESDFSNEVSITILSPAPVSASPDIQVPFVIDLTATTIRLAWKTKSSSTTRLEYTCEGGPFSSIAVSTTAITDHYIRLTELQSGTIYSYEVFCTDNQGNITVAGGSFQTR